MSTFDKLTSPLIIVLFLAAKTPGFAVSERHAEFVISHGMVSLWSGGAALQGLDPEVQHVHQ